MKALIHHRSLRQRLSWWLALQSFAGLGLVCLAVYLAGVVVNLAGSLVGNLAPSAIGSGSGRTATG